MWGGDTRLERGAGRSWHGFSGETEGKALPAWGCRWGLGALPGLRRGECGLGWEPGVWEVGGGTLEGTLRGAGPGPPQPPEGEAGQFAQPQLTSQRVGSSRPLPAASPSQEEGLPGRERGSYRSPVVAGGSWPLGGQQGPPQAPAPARHGWGPLSLARETCVMSWPVSGRCPAGRSWRQGWGGVKARPVPPAPAPPPAQWCQTCPRVSGHGCLEPAPSATSPLWCCHSTSYAPLTPAKPSGCAAGELRLPWGWGG